MPHSTRKLSARSHSGDGDRGTIFVPPDDGKMKYGPLGESERALSTCNPPDLITVVLCDDHELFRHGLAEMLTTAEEIRVVGEGNTHERAVAIVSETRPDVVLLDLQMPGGQAETTVRKMLALPQPPRIVIVTMHGEPHLILRFIRHGGERLPREDHQPGGAARYGQRRGDQPALAAGRRRGFARKMGR